MHLEKEGNEVINLDIPSEILDVNEISKEGILTEENIENAYAKDDFSVAPLATTDYSYKLISGVPDYTWYIGVHQHLEQI